MISPHYEYMKKGKNRVYAFLTQTFVDRHANFLPSFFQFLQKSEQKKRIKCQTNWRVHCGHGILLPKLLWPNVRKNCSSDWEKLLKFEVDCQEFAKILRLLEQFIQIVKGKNNFRNRMLFQLVPGGFSDLIH